MIIKKSLKNKKYNTNLLFFHNDVYDHKLLYEYIIIAFYNDISNIDEEINLLFNSNIPIYMLHDIFNNMRFYIKHQYKSNDNHINYIFESNNLLTQIKDQNNVKIVNYISSITNGYLYDGNIICVGTLSLNQNLNKYLFMLQFDEEYKLKKYSSIFYFFNDENIFNTIIINNDIYINNISYDINLLNILRWFNI
jgi:hypothetical protein